MLARNPKSIVRNQKMVACNGKTVDRNQKSVGLKRKSVGRNRIMVARNRNPVSRNRKRVACKPKSPVGNRKWLARGRLRAADGLSRQHGGVKPALRNAGGLTLRDPPAYNSAPPPE
ncbi:hypothetical protein GCM10027430_19890 [Lysobacter tyrosinilyticus]